MARLCVPNAEPIPGYRLRRCLGKGGAGEVWEVEAPGGVAKAMKVALTAGIDDGGLAKRELDGLVKIRSIRHPFLLAIDRFEVIDGHLVTVMELADCSLMDRHRECVAEGKRGIPRDELLRYLIEASEALDTLNQQYGLSHLDIKPTNLLLSAGHVKIADFGLVQPRDGDNSGSEHTLMFSPGYASPEIFEGQIHATTDQYSLAVTYQELLTGQRPYRATNVVELACEQQAEPPSLSVLPTDDQIIVRKALNGDPEKRFESCSAFIHALVHSSEFVKTFSESQFRMHRQLNKVADLATPGSKSGRLFYRATRPASADEKTTGGGKTGSLRLATTERSVVPHDPNRPVGLEVRATFLASLTMEIYALKLRAYIDAVGAQVINCTEQSTVLRFRERRWLGLRSSKSLFLRIDIFRRSSASLCCVVDVGVWTTTNSIPHEELTHRGMQMIRGLKTCLLATEGAASRHRFDPVAGAGRGRG